MGNVAAGWPWWSQLHTQALETWSSYPSNGLTEAIENGTALRLAPGAEIHTSLCATAYEGGPGIRKVTPEGRVVWDEEM